ncbi:hypothetical protein GCM10023168_11950 [Fodinibacter luteus]|uniref:RAMA domain-containing protein n=1 Tax=Fodinibacter luteus TaxID=552064 RepID=A0ABP8K7P1_9MICO
MWIEIDDDLAQELEQHMHLEESREEVVRRLLRAGIRSSAIQGTPSSGDDGRRTRRMRAGSVADLLRAGLVHAGDELTYRQVRQGITHRSTIDERGQIQTALGVETSPSTALQQLVGFNINGWQHWTHTPSGKTLSALRDELST